MNRQFLTDLGIDVEVIDKIMKAHGKTVNALKDELDEVEGYKTQIKELESQIEDRDKQLDDLSKKAKDNEELTSEIDKLKDENKQVAKEYQTKLDQQAKEFKIDKALMEAKAKNAKAVKALLDLDKVEVKDGEIQGLKEQLEGLQENEGYLFDTGEPAGLKGRTPHNSNPNEPKGSITKEQFEKMSYSEKASLYQENPDLYNSLK